MLQSAMRRLSASKKTVVSRVDSRLEDGQKDAGSLLIDVLIGMAIIALVALIAVSTVGQYREKAALSGMNEDAKSIGVAIEASATSTGTYPASVTTPAPATVGLKASDAGSLTTSIAFTAANNGLVGNLTKGNGYTYVPATDSFVFSVTRTGFTTPAVYNSAGGGVTGLAAK